MTSLLSLRAEYDLVNIIAAIIINILIVYIILKSSSRLERIMGKQGINIIRKVFGIVLLVIAVKLFATNVGKIVG
jgi:multiple antibiotic resistance protein